MDWVFKGIVFLVVVVIWLVGWWIGNVVKYDIIIEFFEILGFKLGMSVEVKVIFVEYEDVIFVLVGVVMEMSEGVYCWVDNGEEIECCRIEIEDNNDFYVVVIFGVKV